MNAKRTRLWRRLGSIAGLGLAVASALVLAGGAPGAQLGSQRSFDASADLSITVSHQPEPACVARFNCLQLAYDVVGFHMQITNPSDTIAQGVGITRRRAALGLDRRLYTVFATPSGGSEGRPIARSAT